MDANIATFGIDVICRWKWNLAKMILKPTGTCISLNNIRTCMILNSTGTWAILKSTVIPFTISLFGTTRSDNGVVMWRRKESGCQIIIIIALPPSAYIVWYLGVVEPLGWMEILHDLVQFRVLKSMLKYDTFEFTYTAVANHKLEG